MEFIEHDVELIAVSTPVSRTNKGYESSEKGVIKNWIEKIIEKAARICYASKPSETDEHRNTFINKLINVNHHESIAEHACVTFKITTRRDVLAEITRHRLASYSVESQRYVNYDKKGLKFIPPQKINRDRLKYLVENDPFEPSYDLDAYAWFNHIKAVEINYKYLLEQGWKPEEARDILPNCTATQIIMTANIREWKHILSLRCADSAYIEMRIIANKINNILKQISPTCFP